MSGNIDIEVKRELWMWRGLVTLLMLFLIITTIATYLKDREQALEDKGAREKAWAEILTSEERIRAMVDKNHLFILKVDDNLRQCLVCHAHPKDLVGVTK